MERLAMLVCLLIAIIVNPASPECVEGNCTDPQQLPVLHLNLESFFPFRFFGPVNTDSEENYFDDAIDPQESSEKSSEITNPQGVLTIKIIKVVNVNDDEDSKEVPLFNKFPKFPFLFGSSDITDLIGILDLSGQTLTGDELADHLKTRDMLGQPVTSLILSNSRIQDLSANSLLPVQDTLQELKMDNCSVNLNALINLSALQMLNLSNTGLTTFQWYPALRDTLQVLDLSHNQLEEVRPELSVLTSLKELYLSHNKISSVSELPLALLPNLEVLALTMNSINEATFTKLPNLKQLDIDWNYIWRFGKELQLPSHRMSVKLASNPWRCDCGLLQARENYDVLDIDNLQCANSQSFAVCDGCRRYYLPMNDGQLVSNLTKDSIEYLGCSGLTDEFYLMRNALADMRDNEPEKLFALFMMFLGCLLLLGAAIAACRRRSAMKKKFNRQSWLKVQQIPYLKIDKLTKPQEVPYIKI